jgi:TonB family protein
MHLRAGVLGSLLVHGAAAAALLAWQPPRPHGPARAGAPASARVDFALAAVTPDHDDVVLAAPHAPPLGPADHHGASSSPWPRADLDAPDRRPADAGGGERVGSLSFTGRDDREELRDQLWNDPSENRVPRVRTAADRATTEARPRTPEPALDTSRRPRRARLTAEARSAAAPAPARPSLARAGDAGDASRSERATAGAHATRPASPLVAAGPTAVDAARASLDETRPRDDLDAAQASDERHPAPFELTTPRAGGPSDGHGVAGPREDDGHSARATVQRAGAGGTPLDVPLGRGQPATLARLQDAYFRFLYARVLERVKYPPELAINLEQGEVVVTFTLRRDGSVADMKVARPSGFVAFDSAVLTAIREAQPFGPVPASVSAGGEVRVNAPFTFDNPLIR